MPGKLPDAEQLLQALTEKMRPEVGPETGLIGIHTGGAWIAERLHDALGLKIPCGSLDVSFYRDDYEKIGLNRSNPQLNENGELHHLLTLEGLPAEILWQILDTAKSFVGVTQREVKKVPLLRGKAVFNLFFEPSTRTRTTFEIAAKRLSADVINLNIGVSSTSKGETLLDTVDNLVAMNADMFVVRHAQSGAPHLIAT